MWLLTVLGCARCGGDAEVVDLTGAWSTDQLAALRAALGVWTEAIGEGRVCIDRVEVGETLDGEVRAGGGVVRVDPDAPYPESQLYEGLCTLLDAEEGLTARAAAVDPEDGERLFSAWCSRGPPDEGWVAQVDAACGGTALSALDWFFLDEVYPHTPPARTDGDLTATIEAPIVLPGLFGDGGGVLGYAPDHDAPLLELVDPEGWRLVRVDPVSGATTELESGPRDGNLSRAVYGGEGGAVLADWDSVEGTVRLEVLDTGVTYVIPVSPAASWGMSGTVADGWLYLASGWVETEPVVAVDLETGEVRSIELPHVGLGDEVLADGLAAVRGGFVVTGLEADVTIDGDMISIGIAARILYRYDRATGTFTELTRDLSHLSSTGVVGADLLVGTLWGDAGRVLGAYAVDDDRLLVSDDVCLSETGDPAFVAGDRAWLLAAQGEDLVLTGITLTE